MATVMRGRIPRTVTQMHKLEKNDDGSVLELYIFFPTTKVIDFNGKKALPVEDFAPEGV